MSSFYAQSKQSKITITTFCCHDSDKTVDTIKYNPTSGDYHFKYEVNGYRSDEKHWKRREMSFGDRKVFLRFLTRHYFLEDWFLNLELKFNKHYFDTLEYEYEEMKEKEKSKEAKEKLTEVLEELLEYVTVSRVKYL